VRDRNAARAERCMVEHLETVRDNMFREADPRQAPRSAAE
jgi:DNA-binding GntR family transcriptional regulator